MYEKYSTTGFDSYESFAKNFKTIVPENFNFAFDVVDVLAQEQPEKRALLWTNDQDEEKVFTFEDISRLSSQAANFFKAEGIKKGDKVMLILKRHYEFWISIIALHKIGAIAIPATHLLTKKDIVYRCNAADIKMIV
ncbi:MAG: AMP-binding protein, partial [Christensenellaceae bacterium]